MTWVIIILGALASLVAVLGLTKRKAGERSGPHNNWKNEDFAAREADGTWTEGSTYGKSRPSDSSGMGL